MKNPIYKRSKNIWNNEQEALNDVVEKQKLDAKKLKAAHTEKHFVWELTEPQSNESKTATFSVEKSEEKTLQDATHETMKHFDTFEGNIKRVEELEDETHYVFAKVRE